MRAGRRGQTNNQVHESDDDGDDDDYEEDRGTKSSQMTTCPLFSYSS